MVYPLCPSEVVHWLGLGLGPGSALLFFWSYKVCGEHFYPARACAKGLSNRFCPSVSLSVR